MSSVDHLGFIVAAYGVTVLTLVITVIALILDGRAQRTLLARLDADGQRRP